MTNLALQYDLTKTEAGCDEAGRGCLAGPVFAAAVILPKSFNHPLLNDSKQLTVNVRNKLRRVIENESQWAVASVSAQEIDQINILNASFLAMHRAIQQLNITPDLLLIDGNKFNAYLNIPHVCMVKGDARFQNIAAASILAKTHRDEYMQNLHDEFPQYDWKKNQGYPTIAHRNAILRYGTTPHHRKTFRITNPQLKLNL